jgi:Thermolysin metallopeptidase, catalytic domain
VNRSRGVHQCQWNGSRHNDEKSKWESECQEAAVQDRDRKAHVAFKRLRCYEPEKGGPYQRDLIFASPTTGALLAVHPKVYSALSLTTYDCMNGDGNFCSFVSSKTSKIHTGDPVANDAHNYLIDVYNFYKTVFNRDFLADAGMPLESFVHFGVDYNNAFYNSGRMVRGKSLFGRN